MQAEKKPKTIVIGLTGGFGTGKSTVARMMARRGAVIVDADKIAHGLMKPGTNVTALIVSHFEGKILKKGGHIDRKRLAKIVFAPGAGYKLDKLCQIVHPFVMKAIEERIKKIKRQGPCGIIVVNAPLLLETGLEEKMDKVAVVRAARRKQIERCRAAYHLNARQVLARIKAQMPLRKKIKRADFVIDNNGSLSETREQVKRVMTEFAGLILRRK